MRNIFEKRTFRRGGNARICTSALAQQYVLYRCNSSREKRALMNPTEKDRWKASGQEQDWALQSIVRLKPLRTRALYTGGSLGPCLPDVRDFPSQICGRHGPKDPP